MKNFSRRAFLRMFALAAAGHPFYSGHASEQTQTNQWSSRFPITVMVLKDAYTVEMLAHMHYERYCNKAVEDSFPNIAYLFRAFSRSEETHAENYKRLLKKMNAQPGKPNPEISVSATKENLQIASAKEMDKIDVVYPGFLKKLKKESHDEAVLNCVYSWKSHRQHFDEIKKIKKYTPFFFRAVAKEIEESTLDFHVCDICGSTIDEKPEFPCDICNYPTYHYHSIPRPA